ncbi:MAG: transglutaminase domain-containing protein, partial [Thermoplasmatota archaeon]
RLDLPDGTWTITYSVGGYEWETFEDAVFDTEAPEVTGLETVVRAPSGSASIGAGAQVEYGSEVTVSRQDGTVVGHQLPVLVAGLADGVHAYSVTATDRAGNAATVTVQVIVGSATQLPEPRYTAGIVARYTTELRLWDLTNLDGFLSPAAARAAAPDYLGSGIGLTPDDPAVRQVVADVVDAGMTTGEAALALYEWLYNNADYNKDRLDEDDLLDPAETIAAKGGVCRDLAALYASLLRAAGIPARLVAGYLTGEVDGFHAWVEFYGGVGPSPWVPVDVSGINGEYKVSGMMQAFGVALPGHLAMRALTPAEEKTDWSTAAILMYQGGEPVAPFLKQADLLFETTKDLCVHTGTFARAARSAGTCGSGFNARIEEFPVAAGWALDYGIRVDSAPDGTKMTLSIVYPDRSTVAPDEVEYLSYFEPNQPHANSGLRSSGFTEDPARGRADAEIRS